MVFLKKFIKFWEFFFQVCKSGDPHAEDIVLSNMRVAFDRMFLDVQVCMIDAC